MQIVTDNLPLILGGIVFVLFTVGLVLALRTQSGRDALARASVRLAVFALGLAEKWLDKQITGEKLAHIGARQIPPQHPIVQAQSDLRFWLG